MRKRIIPAAIGVVVLIVAVWLVRRGDGGARARFELVKIERGDLENLISSTGTLSAVGTVEVGTQVSGTVSRVLADYNEAVGKGHVLAVLDTTLLSAAVRDARGGLVRAQAQHEQAVTDHGRSRELHEKELISESEFTTSETSLKSAHAALLSAQAALDRARANLKYAVIRSPIEGTVIKRNVEPGQTVAASFSTPTLFVIAQDLSKMEILALVDESDIGTIRVGLPVRFTVEAYPEKTFGGVVREIRLQPETVQNVVNYTVVVDAPNPAGLLLPGMTATADFVVDERKDVLLVAAAALRFEATPAMMEEAMASMRKRFESLPDSVKQKFEGRAGGAGRPGAGRARAGGQGAKPGSGAFPGVQGGGNSSDAARLWYLDESGALLFTRVVAGATDGRMTEIVSGREVREGLEVITGLTEEGEEQGRREQASPGQALRGGRF